MSLRLYLIALGAFIILASLVWLGFRAGMAIVRAWGGGRMNYDTMEAGRDMDALVADKLMGWRDIRCHQGGNLPFGVPDDDFNRDVDEHKKHGNCGFPMEYHREPLPMYSHDISAAWEVVEKLTANNVGYFKLNKDFGGWFTASFAIVLSKDDERRKLGYGNWEYESEGNDTAPLAICRAALKAVEGT